MNQEVYTEEHKLFRKSLRAFLEKEVKPNLSQWEKSGFTPKEIWKKMGDMGFLCLSFPEEYGGLDVDYFYEVIFGEELGRLNSGGFAITQQVVQYMSAPYILKHGSDFLKEKYLPKIAAGELISCIGITEPGAGSDVQNVKTKAVLENDHYIVNGSKTFITNAYYGDILITVVKTDTTLRAKGISLLLIELDSPGVSRTKLDKLGWRASDTAELSFDNVKVPKENLIGREGKGFNYLMEGLQLERICFLPSSVANMEYLIETSLEYMKGRKTFGKSIDQYQVLRHRIAQLSAEVKAVKAFSYYCAKLYNQGIYNVKVFSISKLVSTELNEKVATQCLQFFGGYGYMEDYPIARAYRDVRIGTIGGGSSEIMREIISKMVINDVNYNDSDDSQINERGSYFSQTHHKFRKELRTFLEQEIAPKIPQWEQNREVPSEVFQRFGELGYFGLAFSKQYGGSESDNWFQVILHEELAKLNCAGLTASLGAHFSIALTLINKHGNEKQKSEFLSKGISGEQIGCFALTEPTAGSDIKSIQTTATLSNGEYSVNGTKSFVTHGISSDYLVVAVKTKSSALEEGISLLLIPREAKGIRSEKMDTFGWHTGEIAKITFENVRVPKQNLLGKENEGFRYIVQNFVSKRLSIALESVSSSDFALDHTLKYVNEREAFGKKINEFQVVRHKIAQMASDIEVVKQFVYDSYNRVEKGEYLVKESAMAKLLATQLSEKITSQCLSLLGSHGLMEDSALTRLLRDCKSSQIGGGTPEILCELIAESVIDKKVFVLS